MLYPYARCVNFENSKVWLLFYISKEKDYKLEGRFQNRPWYLGLISRDGFRFQFEINTSGKQISSSMRKQIVQHFGILSLKVEQSTYLLAEMVAVGSWIHIPCKVGSKTDLGIWGSIREMVLGFKMRKTLPKDIFLDGKMIHLTLWVLGTQSWTLDMFSSRVKQYSCCGLMHPHPLHG